MGTVFVICCFATRLLYQTEIILILSKNRSKTCENIKKRKWWSIGDANRTLGEDPEGETKEIRELLDESDSSDNWASKS